MIRADTDPLFAFLVGVHHEIQYIDEHSGAGWAEGVDIFERWLVEQIQIKNVDLIAEEWHEERSKGKLHNTVRSAADRAGVRHLWCEPSMAERERLGISPEDTRSSTSINLREQYWLDCLAQQSYRRLIFVCGDGHVDSFQALLKGKGHQVEVLGRDLGKDQMDRWFSSA